MVSPKISSDRVLDLIFENLNTRYLSVSLVTNIRMFRGKKSTFKMGFYLGQLWYIEHIDNSVG